MRIFRKDTQPKPGLSTLGTIGYSIFGDRPAAIFPLSKKIGSNLLKAGIRQSHVIYVSSMFFWALIVAVVTGVVSTVMLNAILPIAGIRVPYAPIMGIPIGALGWGMTLAVMSIYPGYAADRAGRELDKNLMYTANYIAILSSAGATAEQIFTSLSRVGEVYGIKKSSRSVVRDIELLGRDVISALDEESKRTASKDYSAFIQGYISTIKTGGNVQGYLASMSEKFMEARRRLLNRIISQLNLAAEVYVSALVALPIIMITMLTIMGAFGGEIIGGLTADQLMTLMVYVLIPLTGIGVILFIDTVTGSW